MATKREGTAAAEPVVCKECGFDLAKEEGWKIGPVVHCEGGHANVWGNWKKAVHHGHQYQRCRGCQKTIGCDTCIDDEPALARVCCDDCGIFANGERRADPSAVRVIMEAAERIVQKAAMR